jgi:hypothetical protein
MGRGEDEDLQGLRGGVKLQHLRASNRGGPWS